MTVNDVVLRNGIKEDNERIGVVLQCVHIKVPDEIVSENLVGVYWMPSPFGASGIGVNWFGSVVVDGFENGVVDGVCGGLDINDGFWLGSVFVLEEKC